VAPEALSRQDRFCWPTPESHLVEEAKKNYEAFQKYSKDGGTDELPTEIVTEPKQAETEQARNDHMHLLDDLKPRE